MNTKEKTWCLYQHINKINGKKYIGITSLTTMARWGSNGNHYMQNKKFYYAIQKYGWDGFYHIVVVKGLTKDEAEYLEIEMIKACNTIAKGYNAAPGGNTMKGYVQSKRHIAKRTRSYKKKVYQISITDGALIKTYQSVNEAARTTGISAGNISSCCNGLRGYTQVGGYIWRFDNDKHVTPMEAMLITKGTHWHKVHQIDKQTKLIVATYNTMLDAAKATNTRPSDIGACCRGRQKTANGYIWRAVNEI